jgi:hypothetical protein
MPGRSAPSPCPRSPYRLCQQPIRAAHPSPGFSLWSAGECWATRQGHGFTSGRRRRAGKCVRSTARRPSRFDPGYLGGTDACASCSLSHPLAFSKGQSHLLQAAGWHRWATKTDICGPRSKLASHNVLASIGSPGLHQKVGSSQQSAGLDSVGMIVNNELHTMPMKFSQGIQ